MAQLVRCSTIRTLEEAAADAQSEQQRRSSDDLASHVVLSYPFEGVGIYCGSDSGRAKRQQVVKSNHLHPSHDLYLGQG
jgi:hypothetical protein